MSKADSGKDFAPRWGDEVADDHHYCHIPGYILRNYHKCVALKDVTNKAGKVIIRRGELAKVDMQDMMFVIHVMAFKYDVKKSAARPGLPTIAEYAGIHVTSVRRIKQRLVDLGLLDITSAIGLADVYNFKGLHEQCVRLERGETAIPNPPPVVTIAKKKRKLVGWATPSKNATPSKSARSTPSKNASPPLAKVLDEELDLEGNENLAAKRAARISKSETRPASEFNPLKDAIALAFGWKWETMTGNEKGMIQKSAAQLYDAGRRADDIPGIYTYCKKRFDNFTPMALANHQSEVAKRAATPAPSPVSNEDAPKPSMYGGYFKPKGEVAS